MHACVCVGVCVRVRMCARVRERACYNLLVFNPVKVIMFLFATPFATRQRRTHVATACRYRTNVTRT